MPGAPGELRSSSACLTALDSSLLTVRWHMESCHRLSVFGLGSPISRISDVPRVFPCKIWMGAETGG